MSIDIRNSNFYAGPDPKNEKRRLAAIRALAHASEAHAAALQDLARKLDAPVSGTGLVINDMRPVERLPARPWSGEGFYPAQQAFVQPESEEAFDD